MKKKIFLTQDFKNLANKSGTTGFIYKINKIPFFIISAFKSKKIPELLSFIIWEICVLLKINIKPILFEDNNFLVLNEEHLEEYQIQEKLNILLNKYSFRVIKIQELTKIFLVNDTEGWGVLELENNVLIHYKLEDDKYKTLTKFSFNHKISSIYVNNKGYIFTCTDGKVFRSTNNGKTFVIVLCLTNPICRFRFHSGITELPNGTMLLGEYGNLWNSSSWNSFANLYYSFNEGKNWVKDDFLVEQGVNKHIHIVKYFQKIDKLILTDGDNKKQLWVKDTKFELSKKKNNGWKLLTKFHLQMGGHLSAIEFGDEAILGTDYFGGTNFIVRTSDFVQFEKRYIPSPYRRGLISSLQKTGNTLWAIIHPPDFNSSKGLLMMMKKGSSHWSRIIEFDKRNWEVRILSNSVKSTNKLIVSINRTNGNQYSVFSLKYSEIATGNDTK